MTSSAMEGEMAAAAELALAEDGAEEELGSFDDATEVEGTLESTMEAAEEEPVSVEDIARFG
jgi:hypothetical protein